MMIHGILHHVVGGELFKAIPRVLRLLGNSSPVTIAITDDMIDVQRLLYPVEEYINLNIELFQSRGVLLREFCLPMFVAS